MTDGEPRQGYDKQYAQEVLGADCEHCPLRVGGKFVPSDGDPGSAIAFVGEAPGRQEAQAGKPFIGPSGRLLQLVNDRYHIRREDVFLTNACLCRPADGSTPPKAAILACRPRLLKELSTRPLHEADPATGGDRPVVALGNSAALAVLNVEGVTRLRVGPGRTSPYSDLAGRRVIATVHPAACLRQSDMFPSLVTDIGKIGSSHEPWTEPEYEVIDDPVEAVFALRRLEQRAGDLVVDIEVDIDKETSYDHPNRYGQLCVGLCWEEGRALVIGERAIADEHVRLALADALRASFVIAHNGKFDLAGLNPVLGSIPFHFDTMLANYCLDERPGIHGLKQLAVEYLGAPQYDADIQRYVKGPAGEGLEHFGGYGRIPRDKLYKYNAYDVVCTFALYHLLKDKLEKQGLRELHDFLVEAANELQFLELNGIKIDKTYIAELTRKFEETLQGLRDDIADILAETKYDRINPNSVPQVKAALAHMGCKTSSTDKDHINAIIDTLESRSKADSPLYRFCTKLVEHRRQAKLFGTYVKGITLRMYRGRVYSTYSLHASVTGRLASRNPNLQNIVRDERIKRLYIPGRDENVFVQADYAQAELRILCWLAQDPYFREILNDPTRDLFDELTPRLYPSARAKEDYSKDAWSDIRVRVKAFVYGLGYGRTEYSIAKEYKLPVAEAEAVKNRFFETIPAVVDWQKSVKQQVWEGRDLVSPFGRHRRFHLVTNDNWRDIQNEALAFLPQSTSSDVCLRAFIRVRRDLRGSGAFVRNLVHDSILVDSPPDMATDVATLLEGHMVDSARELVGDYVEFRADVKTGKNWSEV